MVWPGWYAIGALALVLVVFYFVRKIPAYLLLTVVVVGAAAATSFSQVDWTRPAEWIVMVVGLLLCVFGLLIVRVMLIRSVSLRLLARIDGGTESGEAVVEDIGGRLRDMRAFRLVRGASDGKSALTGWGWVVSSIVAVFYWLFRIDA